MCESAVYLASDDGAEQLVLEEVVLLQPEPDGFLLVTLYGEQRHVQARIRKIDLLRHRVVLEPVP